jgi:hypothetical protein
MIVKRPKCRSKVSFPSLIQAKRVADKFDQHVYECPVCFCWHTTSNPDWKSEYVKRSRMDALVNQTRGELNKIIKEKNKYISELELKVKSFESEIAIREHEEWK